MENENMRDVVLESSYNSYDSGTGVEASIGDPVEILNVNSDQLQGKRGFIVGWATSDKYIAIVLFDSKLESGELAVCVPVPCLRLLVQP
jgi:hypothetical protein